MSGHDPLRVVWDALEALACGPRGDEWQFRARCPAHDSDSPSLKVGEGADGRALVHCHVGCEPRAVVTALGLTWSDLFPDGHPHAGRRRDPQAPVSRGNPTVEVLTALSVNAIAWHRTTSPRLFVADHCPGCHATTNERHRMLWIADDPPHVTVTCFNGCSAETILAALGSSLLDESSA